MVAEFNWELDEMDVKTAFLHGDLEETIFMKQPDGFEEGDSNKVCLLKKSLYGLKQSPRQWYKKFENFMSKIGFLRSNFDNCVFLSKTEFKNQIVLLLYVDDILIVGKKRADIDKLKSDLNSEFDMKDMGGASKILGIEVIRDRTRGTLFLSQRDYVKKVLRKFGMFDAKTVTTPLASHFKLSNKQAPQSEEEIQKMDTLRYANVVGSIMYTMMCTRPDLAYSLSILSRSWLIQENLIEMLSSGF